MTGQPRTSPYSWVTWIAKLLAGEQVCEFAAWFPSHHQGYDQMPTGGDLALWTINHGREVKKRAEALKAANYKVTIEDQNKLTYRSRAGLMIGLKPDLIARRNGVVGDRKVVDIKTGSPKTSDTVQVILYCLMTGIPDGEVYYSRTGQTVAVGTEAADPQFMQSLEEVIGKILAVEPALKVPSASGCRFCKITRADCPERIETE